MLAVWTGLGWKALQLLERRVRVVERARENFIVDYFFVSRRWKIFFDLCFKKRHCVIKRHLKERLRFSM